VGVGFLSSSLEGARLPSSWPDRPTGAGGPWNDSPPRVVKVPLPLLHGLLPEFPYQHQDQEEYECYREHMGD